MSDGFAVERGATAAPSRKEPGPSAGDGSDGFAVERGATAAPSRKEPGPSAGDGSDGCAVERGARFALAHLEFLEESTLRVVIQAQLRR
ncbi:MAG: hypothetical protein AB7J86_16665 [Vulcanimicrobiota bacterium]